MFSFSLGNGMVDTGIVMVVVEGSLISDVTTSAPMYTTVDIGELGVGEFGSGELESISKWRLLYFIVQYNNHR